MLMTILAALDFRRRTGKGQYIDLAMQESSLHFLTPALLDEIAAHIYDPQGDKGPYNLIHVLGIFLDNALISAPKVNSNKFSGTAVIEGNFTTQSAQQLADLLKSGSLPVELKQPPSTRKRSPPRWGLSSSAWPGKPEPS
jgi:hypothetical protein